MQASIPSGTRDFGPAQAQKRKHIFNTLEQVFILHGYQPIETPAMENLATLAGKYGDEGDQLLYKILNSRLNESKKADEVKAEFELMMKGKSFTPGLTERALRYDLTVPFARFVAMNHNNLPMPFKRYQIQPVWRADRPQKGRYREFYQCDVDVVGSNTIYNEAELVSIYDMAFKKLGLQNYIIKINHRKLLQAIASYIDADDKFIDLTIAIDKLDKIGMDGVSIELTKRGFEETQIAKVLQIFAITGSAAEKLNQINTIIDNHLIKSACDELLKLITLSNNSNLQIDFTLARGLNYYTGCIFEVVSTDPNCTFSGSLSGGGRYDNLTGIFGVPYISGVGISFGADRIYDVMEELNLFPESIIQNNSILICGMDDESVQTGFELQNILIQNNIICELYPEPAKTKKMFGYADKKGLKKVIIIGENERSGKVYTMKDMTKGEQQTVTLEQLLKLLAA
ncbi:MAG: histidine--tRNA ligase [Bacteroidota bacterium]|nr:histidine--tRNA ligase [Bacteroidota bacterium]